MMKIKILHSAKDAKNKTEYFESFVMKLLILLLFHSLHVIISQEPEVNTPLGKVIGKTVFYKHIPVHAFQGIPYAEPPIGYYRFRKPVAVDRWSSPLNATHSPQACVQYSKYPSPLADFLPGQSEDCLYLNIWTPPSSGKKPVMFFLHGGAFTTGSSRLDSYEGRVLATADVVVVTVNYRLGVLGFLYAGTEDAPGNMGLYDMLEALKWVKSHIKYFGGDENNVTVFGQSAGAIAINMLMTSPLAQGYFQRAILESGTTANLDGEDNEKDYRNSQKIAEAVGCASGSVSLADAPEVVVECLREVDAFTLSKTLVEVNNGSQRPVYPRYGDKILPHNPRISLIAGNFEDIDILIGVNNNEGSNSITKARPDVFGYFGKKYPHLNKTFGEILIRENFKMFPDPDAVVEHYLADLDEYDYKAVGSRVGAASGDAERLCPAVYLGEKVAAKGNKVYFYFFQHRPSVTPWAQWMGVVHSDETPFVFGYPLRHPQNYTLAELRLSEYMVKAWTDFAKTGELSSFQWPSYSGDNHVYQSLRAVGARVGVGPHLEDCNFFRDYLGF